MEATTTTQNPFRRYADEARAKGEHDLAKRLSTEGRIAHKLVTLALAAGYAVSVHDGEDWPVKRSTNADEIIAGMFSTDEDSLRLVDQNGAWVGTIMLIYGNGCDLISDYSAPDLDAFSAWIKPVEDFAEEA